MADCPLCGSQVQDRGDVDITRQFERGIARARAAEKVAASLWGVTDELYAYMKRNESSEPLLEAFDRLRNAQQTFREAGPPLL
jgi:hypothetical protein